MNIADALMLLERPFTGLVLGVSLDTVIKGFAVRSDFCSFSLPRGESSGSSCVASARSRGRGYFFFSQVRRVVVRVIDAIIFPE